MAKFSFFLQVIIYLPLLFIGHKCEATTSDDSRRSSSASSVSGEVLFSGSCDRKEGDRRFEKEMKEMQASLASMKDNKEKSSSSSDLGVTPSLDRKTTKKWNDTLQGIEQISTPPERTVIAPKKVNPSSSDGVNKGRGVRFIMNIEVSFTGRINGTTLHKQGNNGVTEHEPRPIIPDGSGVGISTTNPDSDLNILGKTPSLSLLNSTEGKPHFSNNLDRQLEDLNTMRRSQGLSEVNRSSFVQEPTQNDSSHNMVEYGERTPPTTPDKSPQVDSDVVRENLNHAPFNLNDPSVGKSSSKNLLDQALEEADKQLKEDKRIAQQGWIKEILVFLFAVGFLLYKYVGNKPKRSAANTDPS